jgi:hypothetical protein
VLADGSRSYGAFRTTTPPPGLERRPPILAGSPSGPYSARLNDLSAGLRSSLGGHQYIEASGEEGLAVQFAGELFSVEMSAVDTESLATREGPLLPLLGRNTDRSARVDNHQLVCNPTSLAQK